MAWSGPCGPPSERSMNGLPSLRRLGERKYHAESVGTHWKAKSKELEQHAEVIRALLQTTQEE